MTFPPKTRPVVLWTGSSGPWDTGYRVHPDGIVYRPTKTGRWLPLAPHLRNSRPIVRLVIDGLIKERPLAHLILRAFHGPRPIGCGPFHFPDPDPRNCRADNLRWAPRGTDRIGRRPAMKARSFGQANGSAVLTERKVERIRSLYRRGKTVAVIAERIGVGQRTVRSVLTGRTWSHVPDPLGPIVMRRRGAPIGNQNHRKSNN